MSLVHENLCYENPSPALSTQLIIYQQPIFPKLFFESVKKRSDTVEIQQKQTLQKRILHIASHSGCLEKIDNYIKSYGYTDDFDQYGMTPLHHAVIKNHVNAAKMLLDANAGVNILTANGKSPLHLAACGRSLVMLELLLNYGADVNQLDNDGYSPLHVSVGKARNHLLTLKLIEKGAKINAQTKYEEFSPLHLACINNAIDTCRALILAGAELEILDSEGRSPMEWAILCNRFECIQFLNAVIPKTR
jgi:ankyrin repeat protein